MTAARAVSFKQAHSTDTPLAPPLSCLDAKGKCERLDPSWFSLSVRAQAGLFLSKPSTRRSNTSGSNWRAQGRDSAGESATYPSSSETPTHGEVTPQHRANSGKI